MLVAHVYTAPDRAAQVASLLAGGGQARHVIRLGRTVDADVEAISAEIDPQFAEAVIADLTRAGVAKDDIVVHQVAVIRPIGGHGARSWFGADPDDFVWIQLISHAWRNARLLARYLALMIIAGILAAFGIVDRNVILIVGAMAVSPDLLPVCASCVGIVSRRLALVGRALATLFIGMTVTAASAAALVLIVRGLGKIDKNDLGNGGLGLLTTANYSTVGIALAAGVAAMLAFETNASAAVGVAISVTTIPAAAYLGAALASGKDADAGGAFGVLLTNVALLLVAGSGTLALQRRLHRPRRRDADA